jgi:RNA polymerase sigma factor (sigma-70 family)
MTEEECIELICMGGKAADVGLRALYREMGPPMLRFFAFEWCPGDEAKDVLQETIVRVFKAASSYSGNGSAKSWLWQIGRNCLIDHLRKRGRVKNARWSSMTRDGGDCWSRLLPPRRQSSNRNHSRIASRVESMRMGSRCPTAPTYLPCRWRVLGSKRLRPR